MPKEAIDDAHAALKVGGHMVTAMRSNLWVDGNEAGYKDQFMQLVNAGRFEIVEIRKFWRGTEDGKGLFAKQESTLIQLRKTAE